MGVLEYLPGMISPGNGVKRQIIVSNI